MGNPVEFSFAVDAARMMRAMDTDDDIGAVIRLHFEIDRALNHIVNGMVPAPDQLALKYADQRVRLLLALGIPTIRLEPVRVLNKIRNSFAHREGKEKISQDDVREFVESIEIMNGQKIPDHFALVNKRSNDERQWIYSKMTLKEKFCLCGFFALAGVATIENDFQKVNMAAKHKAELS